MFQIILKTIVVSIKYQKRNKGKNKLQVAEWAKSKTILLKMNIISKD